MEADEIFRLIILTCLIMTVLDKRNLPTEQIERILEDVDKWFENFEDKPYISDPDYEI